MTKHHNQFPLHYEGARETFLKGQQVTNAPGHRLFITMEPEKETTLISENPAVTAETLDGAETAQENTLQTDEIEQVTNQPNINISNINIAGRPGYVQHSSAGG